MTLFWFTANVLAVPFEIASHRSPWMVALSAAVAGALGAVLALEKRGIL